MKTPRLTGEAWIHSSEKRNLDKAVVTAVLPAALPVGAAALGLSRIMDGKGPIFTQERFGHEGKGFLMRKIRTMKSLEPGQEPTGRPGEITPLGRVLRPLGIDEIPQLLNILRGDMSVVGPRAFHAYALDWMETALPRPVYEEWQHVYYSSIPGILSSYQIENREGKAIHEQECIAKARMDIADFRDASLRHDLLLMGRAARVFPGLLVRTIRKEIV